MNAEARENIRAYPSYLQKNVNTVQASNGRSFQ